jgi:hypothetical protein
VRCALTAHTKSYLAYAVSYSPGLGILLVGWLEGASSSAQHILSSAAEARLPYVPRKDRSPLRLLAYCSISVLGAVHFGRRTTRCSTVSLACPHDLLAQPRFGREVRSVLPRSGPARSLLSIMNDHAAAGCVCLEGPHLLFSRACPFPLSSFLQVTCWDRATSRVADFKLTRHRQIPGIVKRIHTIAQGRYRGWTIKTWLRVH